MQNDPLDFMKQYGFQAPPNEEIVQAMLAQNQLGNAAKSAQPRLAKQMSRAEALRDREAPRSTHWLSGVAALGNKVAGIRDVKRTEQQQIQGEQALGNSLAAQQQAEAQRQSRLDNNQLSGLAMGQGNREVDYKRGVDAAEIKASALLKSQQAAQAHETEIQRMKLAAKPGAELDEPTNVIDTATGENRRVHWNGQGYVDAETREPIDIASVRGYGEEGMKTQTERKYMRDMETQVKRGNEYLAKDKAYWKTITDPLEGVPTNFLYNAITAGESQGLYDWMNGKGWQFKVSEERRENILESIRVISEIKAFAINPFIEEGIAGAASDKDVERLLGAVGVEGGQSAGMMKNRVDALFNDIRGKAKTQVGMYLESGDKAAYAAARNADKWLSEGDVAIEKAELMGRAPPGATEEDVKGTLKEFSAYSEEELNFLQGMVEDGSATPLQEFALEEILSKAQKIVP